MISKFNAMYAFAAAAVIALGGMTASQAATIEVAGVNGTWTNLGGTPPGLNGLNTNSVSWGTVYSRSKTGRQSGYSFVGAAGGVQESGTEFDLGVFTNNNFVINPGTSIDSVRLNLAVNLLIGGVNRTIATSFDFLQWETLNNGERNGRCANGGANWSGVNSAGCADRVTLVNNEERQERFRIDGTQYLLEITGFTRDGGLFSELWTAEDQANSAIIQARFTAVSAVPLPAAGWMMLAGIGALAASRARRKA